MPYLIDGHNLIPKIPGLSLRDTDDEIQLINILREFCRIKRKRVEVYFDNAPAGVPRTRKFGMVTAHFIRAGTTADAAIRSHLRKIGASARNWEVVTSDRQVASAAREARARFISSEDFARMLSDETPMEKTSPETDPDLSLDPDDVDHWLNLFRGNNKDV